MIMNQSLPLNYTTSVVFYTDVSKVKNLNGKGEYGE